MKPRNQSIDRLRGFVMVLMVLDHARGYWMGFESQPLNLDTTTTALFLTRWVTHLCAPAFVFLAGASAYFYDQKHSPSKLTHFLVTRGLWLILLELTLLRFPWVPLWQFRFHILQVIWALGACMLFLAFVARLPKSALLGIGLALVLGHNLLDPIQAKQLGEWGWLWKLFHEKGMIRFSSWKQSFFVVYPLVPWLGVMVLGYVFGSYLERPQEERRTILFRLAAFCLSIFILLRAFQFYGDPKPWSVQSSPIFTILSFLKCTKYPPSLLYLLVMLGICFLLLAFWDRNTSSRWEGWLEVFGRTPLFFYILHLYLLRAGGLVAAYIRFGDGAWKRPSPAGSPLSPLWGVYIVAIVALFLLYPLCKRFARLKQERPDLRWLRYL